MEDYLIDHPTGDNAKNMYVNKKNERMFLIWLLLQVVT